MPNVNVTPNTPGLIRMARAELATTKAASCRHGIDRSRARCADCDRAETTTKETSK